MDKWIAQDYGTKTGKLEFPIATSVTEDNEGGVAAGTSNISLAVRFKTLDPGSSDRARVEQVFLGTNAQQWLMMGWVGTAANHREYHFPQELRGWLENPVGTLTFKNGRSAVKGSLEVSVTPVVDEDSAAKIGERFYARFKPD